LHRKEAIYYLIKEILSIDVYDYIFRSIDLKANDSMNKSPIKNTNSCIESIDENFPIDLMNVRDHCFKDNSSPRQEPKLLDSNVFCQFGLFNKRTGSGTPLMIKLRLTPFLPRFELAGFPSAPRRTQRDALHPISSLQAVVSLEQNDHGHDWRFIS
jgi:hypothetical protein